MTYAIREATPEDAERLAVTMRQADRDEVWAAGNLSPLEALMIGFRGTRVPYVGLVDGEPACMFGCEKPTVLSDRGMPWLLGSDAMEKHKKVFLRGSRNYVAAIRRQHRLLFNFVDVRNTLSVRWLKWLGFTFCPPQPYGLERLPFSLFFMEGESYV